MSETKILVPYDEYTEKVKDSADLESVRGLLLTDFPDDTCQLLAIKAILGMIPEKEEEPEEPIVDPEPDPEPEDPEENEEDNATEPTTPVEGE